MNIGELWDSRNWDDLPLEPEELEKTIEIHKSKRDHERTKAKRFEKTAQVLSENRDIY